DSLLAVGGKLDRSLGGPPARDITGIGATRRTLYGHIDRLNLPGLLRTFDYPSPDATSPQRDVTTVAPQALFLMNHPFSLEAARKVLERPEIAKEQGLSAKTDRLYRLLFGRPPQPEESILSAAFLEEVSATEGRKPGGKVPPTNQAWEKYV